MAARLKIKVGRSRLFLAPNWLLVSWAILASSCYTRPTSDAFQDDTAAFPPIGSTASAVVTPNEGGTLVLGEVRLEVPSGALALSQTLTVTVAETDGLKTQITPYSAVFLFEPEGVQFQRPVAVRIPVTGDVTTASFYWSSQTDPNEFEALPFSVDGDALVAEISHFSRGFVGGWCQGENCSCEADRDCVDDGNLCNGTIYTCVALSYASNKKVCKLKAGSIKNDCDTSMNTPCAIKACEPKTGQCQDVLLDNKPCDDSDVCAEETICLGGICQGGKKTCQCQQNADCNDSNLCAPKYCDKDSYTCKTNPGQQVVCDVSQNTLCSHAQCDPETGQCQMMARNDGQSCSGMGPPCLQFQCQAGQCKLSSSTCECHSDADCDDENACTAEYCDLSTGSCKANLNANVICPSFEDTQCKVNQCDPETGSCVFVARNEGVACSGTGPQCVSHQCQSGECHPSGSSCECLTDGDCAFKSIGQLCSGTYFCHGITNTCVLNPATQVTCPNVDDTACLKNQCNDVSGTCGMTAVVDGTPCDDLNPCTAGDFCSSGLCQAGASACECERDGDCLDDGDLCTGAPYCDLNTHTCLNNPALDVSCDSSADTVCRHIVCEPTTGLCVFSDVNEGQSCSLPNASPCEQSMCVGGVCATYQSQCACQVDDDCEPYETDRCNLQLICNTAGFCEDDPATTVTCPPYSEDGCSSLSCNPASGACEETPLPNGTACDDSDPCTGPGQCFLGSCIPGPWGC